MQIKTMKIRVEVKRGVEDVIEINEDDFVEFAKEYLPNIMVDYGTLKKWARSKGIKINLVDK